MIEGAHCFVGISLHGNITAVALGRRHLILNLNEQTKLDGLAQMVKAEDRVVRHPDEIVFRLETAWVSPPAHDVITLMQVRLDQHFDHIAEVAEKSAAQRPGRVPDREELFRRIERFSREIELLRRASALTADRLIEERATMAERFAVVRDELAQVNEKLLELEALNDDARRGECGSAAERTVVGHENLPLHDTPSLVLREGQKDSRVTIIQFPSVRRPDVSIVMVTWGQSELALESAQGGPSSNGCVLRGHPGRQRV